MEQTLTNYMKVNTGIPKIKNNFWMLNQTFSNVTQNVNSGLRQRLSCQPINSRAPKIWCFSDKLIHMNNWNISWLLLYRMVLCINIILRAYCTLNHHPAWILSRKISTVCDPILVSGLQCNYSLWWINGSLQTPETRNSITFIFYSWKVLRLIWRTEIC